MREPCKIHDPKYWVESFPRGWGHCTECVRIQYEQAEVCPHCGIKKGFAPGIGDCGCEPDPEQKGK